MLLPSKAQEKGGGLTAKQNGQQRDRARKKNEKQSGYFTYI